MFFAFLWQGFRIIGVNKGDFVLWRIETDVTAGDIVRNDKVTSLFEALSTGVFEEILGFSCKAD